MPKQQHITSETRKYVKRLITEYFYAHNRKAFKNKIWGTTTQILLHWSYIRYARISNIGDRDIPHWKSELENWLLSVCETDMDKKGNSPQARYVAIKEEWDDMEYTFNTEKIEKLIFLKLKKKTYNPTKEEIRQIAEEFVANIPIMMKIMAEKNIDDLFSYLESL